jgi:hypothetical protein
MPRMPNNEDGHVLNATLILYNANTWSPAGRAEFAKWLRTQAKFIKKEAGNFGPRVSIKRWSVDETPTPVPEPAPTPQAKKRLSKLDLKATPRVAKEGRVKAGPRKAKPILKSTPRSKFAVAPYAAGQRLRVKRAGG